MKNLLTYLAQRAREPSTMAGLSVLGVLIGLPPGTIDVVAQCVIGVASVAAAVLPDRAP